jgi:hypothetical protein
MSRTLRTVPGFLVLMNLAAPAASIMGVALGPRAACADIVNTTGAVTVVAPPPSLSLGQFESATEIRAIREQSLVLSAPVGVEIKTPGTYMSPGSPGFIAAGTAVQVYLFHEDIPGTGLITLTGSVTFDTPILGIITSEGGLDATDLSLGVPGTVYNTGEPLRGTFDSSPQDQITLSADLRTVTFDAYRTSTYVDQIRVITEAAVCYANCDASTTLPVLNVADFICFLSHFAAGDSYANCDASTTPPILNVADFVCFQQRFAAGCP